MLSGNLIVPKIHIGQVQPSAISHDKTSIVFLGDPGRRKEALRHGRTLLAVLLVVISCEL
jgi:hypothetical protein